MLFCSPPPLQESTILFDMHPTCCSEEHKCKVKCMQRSPLMVTSALSAPQFPRSARGHTLLCSYLSQMIAVIKQWEFSQVAWGCCAISLFSVPCWVKTDLFALPGHMIWGWTKDKSQAMTKLTWRVLFSWGAELESCAHTELTCWKWTVGSWSKMKDCFVQREWQPVTKWHQKQSWKTWLHATELWYQFGPVSILSVAGKIQRNMLHKSQWKAVAKYEIFI